MMDENLARLRAHRNNIRSLSQAARNASVGPGASVYRASIERRAASVEALLQETFPDRLSSLRRTDCGRTTNLEMTALLHPADAFIHPMDVVEDCDLTSYEKRAILSSWAADACAVKGVPELKQTIHGSCELRRHPGCLAHSGAEFTSEDRWHRPKGRHFGTHDAGESPAF